MLTPKEYAIDRGGVVCPNCESENLTSQHVLEQDELFARQTTKCDDCAAIWDDVYTLQYYENLDLTEVE